MATVVDISAPGVEGYIPHCPQSLYTLPAVSVSHPRLDTAHFAWIIDDGAIPGQWEICSTKTMGFFSEISVLAKTECGVAHTVM